MAIITDDTFAEAADLTLESHVGEVGATWTKHPSYTASLIVKATPDNLQHEETGSSAYYVSSTPSNADYDIDVNLALNAASAAGVGICGRMDTAANTFYHARYNDNDDAWQLYKWVAGTATLLGTYSQVLTIGQAYALKLEMIGSAISVYIDTIQIISVTDTDITSIGRGGVRVYNNSGDENDSALDDFKVTDGSTSGTFQAAWATQANITMGFK